MIKKLTLLFLFLGFRAVLAGNVVPDLASPVPNSGILSAPKNVIKFNLSGLAFKNFAFQAERAIWKPFSFALGYSLMPKRYLPSVIENQLPSDSIFTAVKSFNYSSHSITPEIRFYPGGFIKGAPKGFYLAPYARYSVTKIAMTAPDITYASVDAAGVTTMITEKITIEGSSKGLAFGMLIGSQWIIGQHFSIDWFILGGHTGTGTISVQSKSSMNVPSSAVPAFESAVNDKLSNIESKIPMKLVSDLKATITPHDVIIKGNSKVIGIRAAGINIGFAF